jgi:hypothetical protein
MRQQAAASRKSKQCDRQQADRMSEQRRDAKDDRAAAGMRSPGSLSQAARPIGQAIVWAEEVATCR